MSHSFASLSHRPRLRSIGLITTSLFVAASIFTAACSSSPGGSQPVTVGCGLDPAEVEHGTSADCDSLCTPTNAALCDGAPRTVDCESLPPNAAFDACGVALRHPTSAGVSLELRRSDNVKEYGGSGPPDLSCVTEGSYPDPPSSSSTATLSGLAKIFSHGCQSSDLQIQVFTVKRTGGEDDGEPDQLVGQLVETAEDCSVDGVEEDVDDCDPRFECRYSYPNVPTETELLVVTQGPKWSPIYEYGLYIREADLVDGVYDKDVRALATDDYGVIAQVAIGQSINPGFGAVAGEVHDCGDVRIVNAVVDIDKPRSALTYFTDNEDNPLPDLSGKATSTLGLYAAMNVSPGALRVSAAGITDGKLVGLGYMDLRVFPDAVTSFTFRGLRPHQVP